MGTKYLNEARLQVTTTGNEATSALEAADGRRAGRVHPRRRRHHQQQLDHACRARRQLRLHASGSIRCASGALVEGAFFSNFDERNAAGTWTYRTIEDFTGQPTGAVLAAPWHGRHLVQPVSGRLLLVRRVPRPPRRDGWPRRSQRDAVAHRRQAEPDAARRADVGAVRQPDLGNSRRLRRSSTTGTTPASTTRRCASTASPFATSASRASRRTATART